MHTHDDTRRTLIEWAVGDFKTAKVLVAKEGCVVGDHWHRNKDETFLLLSGRGHFLVGEVKTEMLVTYTRTSFGVRFRDVEPTSPIDVVEPHIIHVPRGTYHRFELAPGSVLLGVATAEFDPADEIKEKP